MIMHFKILSLYRKESTLPSTWMVTPYYCCSSAALAAPFVFEYFVCSVLLVGYFGWECVCLWAFILASGKQQLPSPLRSPVSSLQVDSHLNCHFSSSFLRFSGSLSPVPRFTRANQQTDWNRGKWEGAAGGAQLGSSTAIHHTHCCVRASI